jgi:hypothetical protein
VAVMLETTRQLRDKLKNLKYDAYRTDYDNLAFF